jgi:hypothetical protein
MSRRHHDWRYDDHQDDHDHQEDFVPFVIFVHVVIRPWPRQEVF